MDGADRARAPRARRGAHRPRSVTILDTVHVEAYGSMMPLNQVASLSIPEPTLIVAQPFDPSLMGAIEKAIRSSNLGLNPTNDGKVVRIPIPRADRRAPQGALEARAQARRGRPQRRPPGPPRRERSAEEAAQGSQDLGRRRAARTGGSAEDHRPAHHARSTTCRRRRTRSCSGNSGFG